jgi:hypothetical protein
LTAALRNGGDLLDEEMKAQLQEWKDLWDTGYTKFVPELFSKFMELERENRQLKEKLRQVPTYNYNDGY